MQIYKNSDYSFDIVNANRVLFHAKNGTVRLSAESRRAGEPLVNK